MRRQRWTSKPCFAKSISIKSGKRRSDGYARKAAGITPGNLPGVAETQLRPSRGRVKPVPVEGQGPNCLRRSMVPKARLEANGSWR